MLALFSIISQESSPPWRRLSGGGRTWLSPLPTGGSRHREIREHQCTACCWDCSRGAWPPSVSGVGLRVILPPGSHAGWSMQEKVFAVADCVVTFYSTKTNSRVHRGPENKVEVEVIGRMLCKCQVKRL